MPIRWVPTSRVGRVLPLFLLAAALFALAPVAQAACGNGTVEPAQGEDCDDGSSQNGGPNSCCSASCRFNGKFPDVIVGELTGVTAYTPVGAISAYSFGTTSCNIGSCWLNWFQSIPEHPVIGQNLYRLKSGRFEHIGQSWLKHGFTALAENLCSNCPNPPPNGNHLGVNCSDPYGSGLNGQHSRLGPKWEVNPYTGVYTYPYTNSSGSGSIYKRLQVRTADLDPAQNAGALYFAEAQYVTRDDAAANKHDNNASYRRVNVTGASAPYTIAFTGSTQRQQPGIRAWKANDAAVTEATAQAAGDGYFIVAAKATALGGGVFHYEYAVENLNSDRAAQSFSVPITPTATVTNIGFHDVDYHSGEPFSGTDWTGTFAGGSVTWATETHAANPNANALRWGTLYNFRFDANVAPSTGTITLAYFKPGSPTSLSVTNVTPFACAAVETACGSGLDEDCDGQADCADSDCCTSAACSGSDADGDTFASVCDCNDASAAVYPGAAQLCDGLNNDCGAPGWPAVPANELDADGDGVRVCGGDCDDTHPLRYPGNVEACDGLDNDCAGGVPANEADADADGVRICGGDCDDTDEARYPGNPEVCDGIDNDCAGGLPPDELDGDGDGHIDCESDCDGANPAVWATPGEVRGVRLAHANDVTTLTWDPPASPGCIAPRYDTLRSQAAADFVNGADCVEADDVDTTAQDASPADSGVTLFYLIRCENDCPFGEGSLGLVSDLTPRTGRLCP